MKKKIPNNERFNFNKKNYNATDKDKRPIECLDGYLGCKNIMSNVTPLLKNDAHNKIYTIDEYIPAIMLAHRTKVYFNSQWYNGYLPAIGQLMFLSANISKMNSALNAIDKKIVKFEMEQNQLSGFWWSSTQYNASMVWSLDDGRERFYGGIKDDSGQVLPFFAV